MERSDPRSDTGPEITASLPNGKAGPLQDRLWHRLMLARARQATGMRSYREVGQATGTPAETARRYLTVGKPTARFVAALCDAFGVSADWILLNRGAGPPPEAPQPKPDQKGA
jgi:hypothetical protein